PVQHGLQGAVAPHLGGVPRGRRNHQRPRCGRLPAGHGGRRRATGENMTTSTFTADLPDCDVAGRAGRLGAAMEAAGCDALLVTNLTNIRYLTGFTGSAALLVATGDRLVFVTDGRYRQQS